MADSQNMFVRLKIFLVSLLLFLNALHYASALIETKVYIVYMGARQHDDVDLITSTHHDMLTTVLGSREAAADSMIYSYRHGFSGFAAKMTKSQAQTIAELPGVVKVIPNYMYKLRTTRSWDYLGLSLNSATNLLHDTKMGDGTIIAVLDSGVEPENAAYNDKGLGPIPSKWKGFCEGGETFDPKTQCNRKLIGARWFISGYVHESGSPGAADYLAVTDTFGHGTHTSTTAAGSLVHNISYKGLAVGTLRGGAPRSRLAIYKISWEGGHIAAADTLKAFDEAIHDGVDVISASFGADVPLYSEVDPHDVLSLGSFHAVAHGITVVAAGGNQGPAAQTVSGAAPWVITVAACTHDRAFPTPITLGNGQNLMGEALFAGNDTGLVSLTYPDVPAVFEPRLCETLSENDTWIAGNVVLCFTGKHGAEGDVAAAVSSVLTIAKQTGGLGVIVSQKQTTALDAYSDWENFPIVQVDYEIGTKILLYIRSTRNPKVRLSPTKTHIGKPISTVIPKFSSRGPNTLAPAILKPDIAAPGTNILAGYRNYYGTWYSPDGISAYNVLSGTSMATPHVAGIVALLKAAHPDWSPTAIKSAIVTTAWTTDPHSGEPIFNEGDTSKLADAFDYGGGIINPNRATDPGLVYDMSTTDYIHCLCAMGYNHSAISKVAGHTISCPKGFSIMDVNFPSIIIPNLKGSITLTRTVTNVGPANSKYKVVIEPPKGISVAVKPDTLTFNLKVKKISFDVTISTSHRFNTGYYFGSLTWNDGKHNVRISISVKTVY